MIVKVNMIVIAMIIMGFVTTLLLDWYLSKLMKYPIENYHAYPKLSCFMRCLKYFFQIISPIILVLPLFLNLLMVSLDLPIALEILLI